MQVLTPAVLARHYCIFNVLSYSNRPIRSVSCKYTDQIGLYRYTQMWITLEIYRFLPLPLPSSIGNFMKKVKDEAVYEN